jgi:hypothetical protein
MRISFIGGPLDGLRGEIHDVAQREEDGEVNEALSVMGITGGKYHLTEDGTKYQWETARSS